MISQNRNKVGLTPICLTSVTADASTNRINTTGWFYDVSGNLVRGQDANGVWQRFEYDAAGRLKVIKDDSGSVIYETYTYGASRERLINEYAGGRTYYVWGGSNVIAEYTETTSGTTPTYAKSYVYAGSRLLSTFTKTSATTESKELHHPDRLGTKLVTDGSGVDHMQSTLPFGTEINAEGGKYINQVFTSYDRSPTTGLDYSVNRSYSKGQSRFTQVDPLGNGAALVGNPQSNNLYAYTQNMPTEFVDPNGLQMVAKKTCRSYTQTYWTDGHYDSSMDFEACTTQWVWQDDVGDFGGGDVGGVETQSDPPRSDCQLNIYLTKVGISGTISGISGNSAGPGYGPWNHAYATLKDSSDSYATGYRAAMSTELNLGTPLVTESGLYAKGYFSDYEKSPVPVVTENYGGQSCDKFKQAFSDYTNKVQRARLPYQPLGNNSNAFIYSMLKVAGIDADTMTPRIHSALGTFGSLPGWGNTLPVRK